MRILLIEDDKRLCDAIKLQLERAGYETDCCGQGQEAFCHAAEHPYDVIILGRMFPHMDGLSVLGDLRRIDVATPVIVTTALDDINDRINGLDVGADDYLVKPYAVEELFAKIRALIRQPGGFKQSPVSACSNISLDPEKEELTGPQGTLQLNKHGSAPMEYLIHNTGQVLPSGLILSYIWGPDSDMGEGNLDNHIYSLRRRLESIGALPQIKTIHEIGYRLENGRTHD